MTSRPKLLLFWTLFLICISLTLFRLAGLSRIIGGRGGTGTDGTGQEEQIKAIRVCIFDELVSSGMRMNWLSGDSLNRIVRVPMDLPMIEAYRSLAKRFRSEGAQVIEGQSNPDGTLMTMGVGYADRLLFSVTLRRDAKLTRTTGEIALVILDCGKELDDELAEVLSLPYALTLGVVPDLAASLEIADRAQEAGMEVLAQLPRQGFNGRTDSDFFLSKGSGGQQLRDGLHTVRQRLPQAAGLMVSGASLHAVNTAFLTEFSEVLEREKFYALWMAESSPPATDRWSGFDSVPALLVNDLRLDRIPEAPYIRRQLIALAEQAIRSGSAIGTVGVSGKVVELLKTEIAALRKRGLRFVTLSELLG